MPGNSIGQMFRVTTFGESHGEMIGVVVDGCPAGLGLDVEFIQGELDRRKPGQSRITTQRKESDTVRFVSGVYEGKTTGAPIAALILNEDQRSKDYGHLTEVFRPSHADFTYDRKYGHRDPRGGGRSSARETAARVVAGGIAKLLLRAQGVRISAYVSQVGSIRVALAPADLDLSAVEKTIVRCPELKTAEKMIALIEAARADGDTVGGVITGVIRGCPVGLGEPVFDRLHADLGKAMLSINAVKGFEYGSGFAGVELRGSEHNDAFLPAAKGKAVRTATNHSGGIQGGISNGMDIEFRVAFKPVATIMKAQESVDKKGRKATVEGKGRHDPCVVPRAVPIVEAMAAITLADHWLRDRVAQLGEAIVKIAIQGIRASFHDVAARRYFGNQQAGPIEPVECRSFKALAESLKSGKAELALMAIENSIAGSILTNYALLESYGFKIRGEIYLRIELALMALPGERIEDIQLVRSHPMALLQCQEFLNSHPWIRAVESADTAESARDLRDEAARGQAAIASRQAAEAYGLALLSEGIETDPANYTRFLVIGPSEGYQAEGRSNKASIRFEVTDRPGSLARVLKDFSDLSINMTKIQSVPILGRPYEYSFHVDLEWPEGKDAAAYREALNRVQGDVVNLIHFGEYVRSERPTR